jgi:hypothetical protein
MASKLNSEFNYRYLVQGETIWEKIKTLKGFLEGRIRAAALEAVAKKKLDAKYSKLQYLKDKGAPEYEIMEQEADILEAHSFDASQEEAFLLNKEEIKMLGRLLEEAFLIAEPSRIKGYTDEQMFEANAANEFTVLMAREIQAEIIANGRPSPAKLKNAMSNPITFNALKMVGFIPEDTHMICGNDSPLSIEIKVTVESASLINQE